MKFYFLAWLVFTVGCSHKKVEHKVTMDLPFAPDLVEEMQKAISRTPASLTDQESGKSPRRVYFSALYHQYLTLGHHLGEVSQLNSCPQFHHDKIETDSLSVPKFSLFKVKKLGVEEREFFPEVVFNKSFSLLDHYRSINEEVATLCEEGVSDNYFKFDNLVTHYATKASFHTRPDSMRSVLKIPVFANYYLLKMLQSPQRFAFVHPEERRAIELTQTHWFEKYVNEAQRLRNNVIKDLMVQR